MRDPIVSKYQFRLTIKLTRLFGNDLSEQPVLRPCETTLITRVDQPGVLFSIRASGSGNAAGSSGTAAFDG
jgi:hypothetical protein